MEPNDIILLAELIELNDPSPVVVSGEIGDNRDLLLPSNDVDLFAVSLNAGDTLLADINAEQNGSELDSVLTLFDANGIQLAQDDDNGNEFDSLLEFTVGQDGLYYLGVSSFNNLNYDPNDADSSSNGETSGVYDLVVSRETTDSSEPNDTISLARAVELDSLSPVTVSGEIGDNPGLLLPNNDVDLFAVSLNAGDTLFADINAEINGSTLDSVLTIFDANGNLLVQNDDNSFENVTEPDSFQQFTALLNGTYYVGVSSSANLGYDPNVANSGVGNSSGIYNLVLTLLEGGNSGAYSEPNDTILLANPIERDVSSPGVVSGEIGDNPELSLLANDVDLFEVELKAGDTIFANIDAQQIGSSLDAVLTLFDANGNELEQNEDNSFFVGEELVTELDPFLQFTVDQDGTYYVGVTGAGNLDYDPNVADSGVGNSSGSYRLDLRIEEEQSSLFTTSINRFQNSDRPGTYLFAGEQESQSIRANFPNFVEEGQAFKVAVEPGDGLIRINRFQNSNVPGTYLYAGEQESQSIRTNFPNFIEEGVAFYVYDGAANIGEDFYRFQNLGVPGTYIFVAGEERQNILDNFPSFVEEGIAFEVEI